MNPADVKQSINQQEENLFLTAENQWINVEEILKLEKQQSSYRPYTLNFVLISWL